ncbi:MAG TPA: TerB family tellurite resistance protein [Nevskiales bacterium]|nr:TerB family tellurite resistance protein [Nevskiales bacterium]
MKRQITGAWQRLHGLLRNARHASDDRERDEQAIRLAAAVLLVEMARADAEHPGPEREALRRELQTRFGLDAEAVQALLTSAERTADRSVSLHAFLDDINTGLEYPEKLAVLKMLWQVAYADGRLDRHEEHLMRRFADLLHLTHADFIRLKLEVLGQRTG